MAYSIWDKQPQLVLPQVPFEFLGKLAESQKQDLDKVDERIGATQGLFSKLVAAPGHETLAENLTSKYNKQLSDTLEKHKNNPLSRELNRDLIAISSSFANDPKVQTVFKSKDFYDKYGPELWKQQSTASLINAPGILDDTGTFIPNEITYDIDKFKITPFAESRKSVQEQFKILRDAKLQTENVEIIDTNPDGSNVYNTKEEARIWNDETHRKEVFDAINKMVWDKSNSDQGLRYLRAKAEQLYPNDINAQELYVADYILTSGVPFNLDQSVTKSTISNDKKTKGADDTDGVTKIGAPTTVGLDPIVDKSGKPIKTVDALQKESTAYQSDIDNYLSAKNLHSISSDLVGVENGQHVINPNAIITSPEGYEIINTDLITNSFEKDRAIDTNMSLIHAQNKQMAANTLQQYFAEKAIDGKKDDKGNPIMIDPLSPIEPQLLSLVDEKTKNEVFDNFANTTFPKIYSLITSQGLWSKLTEQQRTEFVKTAQPIKGADGKTDREATYESRIAILENLLSTGPIEVRESIDIALNGTPEPSGSRDGGWYNYRNKTLKQDPVYQKYSSYVEKYLQTNVVTQGYNYSISKPDQLNRMKQILPLVIGQRKLERANWDMSNASQHLGDTEKKVIYNDIRKQVDEGTVDYGSISIRYDESKAEFVVDIPTEDYGIIEVGGFDQQSLADIVRMQDPHLTSQYLQKKSSLLQQLDASNGRLAYYNVPIKDDNDNIIKNDRIVVKNAIETLGEITQGDYLFALPEVPGMVFAAKSSYAVVEMLDGYREAVQAYGTDTQKIQEAVHLLKTKYNVKPYTERYKNIGSRYFPTNNSKISPSGK